MRRHIPFAAVVRDISTTLPVRTVVSGLSRRLREIISDPALNPWRRPILRRLNRGEYGADLANLSLRMIVPKYNWIEIMSKAHPEFLLFEATVPNLNEHEWEECFRRRFLPGWAYWKKSSSWRVAFHKYVQGPKYPRLWQHSVFWVLECCTGFGIEPIHRARLTKLGQGPRPVPVPRLLSKLAGHHCVDT